ncbi:MAG: hypothetical protein ACJ763_02910 [Bdellovibrionia bacterium]
MAISTREPVAGFAITQALIMMSVLAVVCAVLLPLFQKGINQEVSRLAIAELDETFIEMATILRRKDSCLVSLGSPSSPNTQNLTIYYSMPIPTTQGPEFLKSGDKGRFKIDNIEIGLNSPSTPIGPANASGQVGQLGFLRVTAHTFSSGNMLLIRELPIYFLTNASGTSLSSCFITKFSKVDQATGKKYTVEDQTCQTAGGMSSGVTPSPTAVYDPANKTCI